jgi:hypothetical protein
MARAPRRVEASRSAAASRSKSARKATPASARLGRRTDGAPQTSQRGRGGATGRRAISTGGPVPRTRQQLYQEAKMRNIKGRSTMTKAELARALGL